ncbi:hypothetical protein [Micromonospora endolithica]|uniref:Uncharacterized protein n=1 Tax=Micromonospora endolithica TaxID=230091 RepID=A0A3A9ZJC2_9ACTN|nr:hypothetical protein [Micromonospora endolithica]RKN48430.1 hypothetical protein D7223_10535 [Micromonospora endolithica]TWJ24494.1 hypothetical protein JD76_04645 [Micromonospora endolithica]
MPLNGPGGQPEADALPVLFPAPEAEAPSPRTARRSRSPGRDDRPPDEPDGSAGVVGAERDGPPSPPDDDAARQLAFFGADAADPSLADLAGLLVGPAEMSVMGGTARLSVLLDRAWRVHVLVGELAQRGISANWAATDDARHAVRTSYTRLLKPLAAAWLRGPALRPPAGFHLNGRRLRLWLAAAGTPEPPAVLLRLGPVDQECWEPVGAALAAVGLPDATIEAGPDGPVYRVTGRRQLARLAELVGDRPPAAPAAAWPARS